MMTCSTCSTPITAGLPGLGSSTSPSRPRSTNLPRHLRTVGNDTPSSRATWEFEAPDAAASTIRHRSASAWEDLRRLDE